MTRYLHFTRPLVLVSVLLAANSALAQAPTKPSNDRERNQQAGPLQGASPLFGGGPLGGRNSVEGSRALIGAGLLRRAWPLLSAGPLVGADLLQGAAPVISDEHDDKRDSAGHIVVVVFTPDALTTGPATRVEVVPLSALTTVTVRQTFRPTSTASANDPPADPEVVGNPSPPLVTPPGPVPPLTPSSPLITNYQRSLSSN